MKVPILDTKKAKKGERSLPKQFEEEFRPDLIQRAVLSLQAGARQPYGADPEAGKRSSAELSRRRRKYRGSYGQGISRVPRKILSRRGNRIYYVGAFAPGTVGGRRAHPPKAEKNWVQKVNTRENRKAIRSALGAVMDREIVIKRGHKIPSEYPFILDNSFEKFNKTKDVEEALRGIGFGEELARAEETKVRGGKSKMRGRKRKRSTSLLIVIGANKTNTKDSDSNSNLKSEKNLLIAAKNIPGVDVVTVNSLNAELLAPGTHPGRATLFTESAMDAFEQGLFTDKRAPASSLKPKSSTSQKERSATVPTEKKKVGETA